VPALWRSPSPRRGQVGAGVEDVERGPLEALRVTHRTRHAGRRRALAGGLSRVVLADPPLAPAGRTGRLGQVIHTATIAYRAYSPTVDARDTPTYGPSRCRAETVATSMTPPGVADAVVESLAWRFPAEANV